MEVDSMLGRLLFSSINLAGTGDVHLSTTAIIKYYREILWVVQYKKMITVDISGVRENIYVYGRRWLC